MRRLWADDVTVWKSGDPHDRDKAKALRVIDWFVTATTERDRAAARAQQR